MKEIKNIKQFIFKTDAICIFCIEVLTLLFLCFITQNNFNIFSTDDNIMQWEPVIQKGFDYLFETGSFAYIDFYQYGKMNILDVGFYGFTNPLMFLSYIISRFIFSVKIHVLPIYITLSILTGNIFFYKTLKLLKIKPIFAFLATLSYVTMPFFYVYAFYYFSFNNYFFIPLFVFIFLKSYNSKLKYVAPGICLGFACFLGHAQYWVYYYMVYTIMEFVLLFLEKNWKRLYVYFSNLGTSILICLPNIILLAQAGIRRAQNHIYRPNESEFLSIPTKFNVFFTNFFNPLKAFDFSGNLLEQYNTCLIYLGPLIVIFFTTIFYIIYKILPHRDIRKLSNKYFNISFLVCLVLVLFYRLDDIKTVLFLVIALDLYVYKFFIPQKYTHILDTLIITTLFLIPELFCLILLYALFLLFRSNIQKKELQIPTAFLLIILFFGLLGWGASSFIAPLLQYFPVLSQFRYLYKCYFIVFVFIHLFAPYITLAIKSNYQKVILYLVFFLNVFMNILHVIVFYHNEGVHSFINNRHFSYNRKTIEEYIRNFEDTKQQHQLDFSNYRFASVLDMERDCVDYASIHLFDLMTKNSATYIGAFFMGGYDDSFSEVYVKMADELNYQKNIQDELSEISYTIIKRRNYILCNLIPFNQLSKMSDYSKKEISSFVNAIETNAIKYVIFANPNSSLIEVFENAILKQGKLHILKKVISDNGALIVELDNLTALVSSNVRQKVPLDSKIARLRFDKEADETEFRLSFVYDDHYKATFCNDEGICSDLNIKPDKNEYTRIYVDQNLHKKKGKITMVYRNLLCDLTMLFAFLSWLLMFWILIKLKGEKS